MGIGIIESCFPGQATGDKPIPVYGRAFVNRRAVKGLGLTDIIGRTGVNNDVSGNLAPNGVGIIQFSSFLGLWCDEDAPDFDSKITADSEPNHDGWGPDCFWSCENWVTWHKRMVEANGKTAADSKWVQAYDASSYGAHEISCGTKNPDFKAYVQAQGLDKQSTILAQLYRAEKGIDTALQPVYNMGSALTNVTATVKDTTQGADTVAKVLPWLFVAVAVGVSALLLYFMFKKQSINVI